MPCYNHAATLALIVSEIRELGYDVLVVNDGSNDGTVQVMEQLEVETKDYESRLYLISYPENRGKGYAIYLAIKKLNELGYRYGLSLDADGQHSVKDILSFTQDINMHDNALYIGYRGMNHINMPGKNSFANRFSNFWFMVQTGQFLPDTQSGFRLYPVHIISKMHFLTTRYEWELEVLVRAAWAQLPLVSKPISVYYPPKNERISHFRPVIDFLRISLLNTMLCFGALLYFYPLSLFRFLFCKSNR